MTIRCVAAALLLVAVSGCAQAGAGRSTAPGALTSSPATETEVQPVSLSSATGLAKQGITLCDVESHAKQVAGIGIVARADLLPKYIALTGREPEIATTEPAFVVQFSGTIRVMTLGAPGSAGYTDVQNASCVVIGGREFFYVTGPWIDSAGRSGTPEPAQRDVKDLPAALP